MDRDDVWPSFRPHIVWRVGFLVLGAFLLLVGALAVLVAIAGEEELLPSLIVGGLAGGITWWCWRAWVVALLTDPDGVTVRNFFGSHRLGWSDIERFEMPADAAWGIYLVRRSGSAIMVTAITKPPIASWFKRRTRADQAVEYLNSLLEFKQPAIRGRGVVYVVFDDGDRLYGGYWAPAGERGQPVEWSPRTPAIDEAVRWGRERAPVVLILPAADDVRAYWAGAEPPVGPYADLPVWQGEGIP